MNALDKQDFLRRNKEAFEELNKIIHKGINLKNIDPAKYPNYELECRARRYAVSIVESWIGKLFTDAFSYDDAMDEEEGVYKFHESNLREENRDN
jgi:hypothetical protein